MVLSLDEEAAHPVRTPVRRAELRHRCDGEEPRLISDELGSLRRGAVHPGNASWRDLVEPVSGFLTRQVLEHGWFTTAQECDRTVHARARERSRTHRPVRST